MRRPKAKSTPLVGKAPLGSLPADDSATTQEQHRSMDTPSAKDLAPPALPMLEYEVVRHRGHWRVLHMVNTRLPAIIRTQQLRRPLLRQKNRSLKAGRR
jgi:hypothetical protein